MTATSTHDAKRGEDARARINVLSEIPRDWRTAVSRWSRATAAARSLVGGATAPDRRDEYFFYQALVGAWPAGLDGAPDAALVARMREYMQKAVKEAKVHTSWINPSPHYDEAVSAFVEQVLAGPSARGFLRLFVPFAARVARLGAVNALAQLVLKVASPGVPDFYQGTELWDLSLVDPDNRQPVDFNRRMELLDGAAAWLDSQDPGVRIPALAEMLTNWYDGRVKLCLTAASLHLRRVHRDLFLRGDYLPLAASGERAAHVVALARRREAEAVIAVVPRLVATTFGAQAPLPPAADAWRDLYVEIPETLTGFEYRHVFTGERVTPVASAESLRLRVADLLQHVPVALLIGTRTPDAERRD
jgi:(1->4)-alpha-D-glucan 1-alpha-D-glucosylmutase